MHVVRNLLGSMKQDGVVADSSTFKLLLDAFIRSGQFDSAIEILDQMEEFGASLNPHMYNSILVALVRKNQLGLALSMFFKVVDTSTANGSSIALEARACNELLLALRRAYMRNRVQRCFL
ncbi:hypothetical protein Nepgr_015742 [Nepenthes gracilis]|uniref:Pentatricopeptide repeat-containing protein-mitochondrial domain-containing protein n=1 Tax=Nepenthes gracilis TaxID=150966 RepID=A0AAD3SP58_NEPGR|nr:hypothetical protein Nepgr_015742 [Nepenthes gracilis]